jgi:mitochondrial distribution and morphology protein 10
MMGHISGAYAARVSPDLSLSSRFDFNVYSYESEWTMGAEWWMRSSPRRTVYESRPDGGLATAPPPISPTEPPHTGEVYGVVKARASTNNVRFCAVPIVPRPD